MQDIEETLADVGRPSVRFTRKPTGRRVSYRVGIELQAKSLARAILDPDRRCRAVRWK